MKITQGDLVGEAISFAWDEDLIVVFLVIWYGRPGTEWVRADLVEPI